MLRNFAAWIALSTWAAVLSAQATGGQGVPLTPEQQQLFIAARQDFSAGRTGDAFAKMKELHEAAPGNRTITDGTAETAIVAKDREYAIRILKEERASAPDDVFALQLLTRAYAESGNAAERDAGIRELLTEHQSTTDPQFRQQTQFLVESIPLENGRLDLYDSLTPWSRYNIYAMGRVLDAAQHQIYRITLESSDMDQTLWAKDHPDLAAKGMRVFTLDGYTESQRNPNGTITQTHATFGFLNGQPSYDDLRTRMLAIASRKQTPMSSTTGTHPPQP